MTKSARKLSSMTARTVPRNEAARMVARLTRASPTMRAAAVAAVRRGLRMAFSRASVPGRARRRRRGAPIRPATGWVKMGLITAMPTKTVPAPAPTKAIGSIHSKGTSTNRPIRRRATPPAVMAAPAMTRGRIDRRPVVSICRMAATGGTEAARRAGRIAETRVTRIPTAAATATVRPCTSRARSGRSPPKDS